MPPARRPVTPLRMGVLGYAEIARQFCRDVAGSATVRADAVASRDAAKAAAFAADFGIPRAVQRSAKEGRPIASS